MKKVDPLMSQFLKINPDTPVDLMQPKSALIPTLEAKYYTQIRALERDESYEWERKSEESKFEILVLLEKLQTRRFFRDSQPRIDVQFLLVLTRKHYIKDIKKALNEMYIWLTADAKRAKKNYRKFIFSWLSKGSKNIEIHYHGGEE